MTPEQTAAMDQAQERQMTPEQTAAMDQVREAVIAGGVTCASLEVGHGVCSTSTCSDDICAAKINAIARALLTAKAAQAREFAQAAFNAIDDAPSAPYDNGGTRDGWHQACYRFENEANARAGALEQQAKELEP